MTDVIIQHLITDQKGGLVACVVRVLGVRACLKAAYGSHLGPKSCYFLTLSQR